MTRDVPQNEAGFTLVEMMVALAIFAMLSVAGVALLQSASSSQLVVKERLSDLSEGARAVAMIEADLAQAVTRPVRTSAATNAAAFSASGSEAPGQIFAVSRAGQANLDDSPKPELERIAYAVENGALKRVSWSMLDGGKARPATILSDVATATVRFRDVEGVWRSTWDATDPLVLPRAVELVLTQKSAAPVRLLFLVGTGSSPKVDKDAEADDDAAA
jgi:general secretion pathway protein J